jgi:hypothetical protein
MSDDRVLRFRVTGLDPVAVELVRGESLPQHKAAIETWIAAARGIEAA